MCSSDSLAMMRRSLNSCKPRFNPSRSRLSQSRGHERNQRRRNPGQAKAGSAQNLSRPSSQGEFVGVVEWASVKVFICWVDRLGLSYLRRHEGSTQRLLDSTMPDLWGEGGRESWLKSIIVKHHDASYGRIKCAICICIVLSDSRCCESSSVKRCDDTCGMPVAYASMLCAQPELHPNKKGWT